MADVRGRPKPQWAGDRFEDTLVSVRMVRAIFHLRVSSRGRPRNFLSGQTRSPQFSVINGFRILLFSALFLLLEGVAELCGRHPTVRLNS